MAKARHMMVPWVIEALEKLGGKGTMVEVARSVWERHEPDIRAYPDLLYEWQYELRWAAFFLRRDGKLRKKSPRGLWELG
jgi:hypothetical protein